MSISVFSDRVRGFDTAATSRREIHEKPLFYWAFVERTKTPRGSVGKRETGVRERVEAFWHSHKFGRQTETPLKHKKVTPDKRHIRVLMGIVAERMGFEPTIRD